MHDAGSTFGNTIAFTKGGAKSTCICFGAGVKGDTGCFRSGAYGVAMATPRGPVAGVTFRRTRVRSKVGRAIRGPLALAPSGTACATLACADDGGRITSIDATKGVAAATARKRAVVATADMCSRGMATSFGLAIGYRGTMRGVRLNNRGGMVRVRFGSVCYPIPIVAPTSTSCASIACRVTSPSVTDFCRTGVVTGGMKRAAVAMATGSKGKTDAAMGLVIGRHSRSPCTKCRSNAFVLGRT